MKVLTSNIKSGLSASGLIPEASGFPSDLGQAARILDSYRHWFGKDLVSRVGSVATQARQLFTCDQVVLSCGNESDPVMNYGNLQALKLWEMPWSVLVCMPARLTAEPMEQPAREAFLQRVRRDGFITDYEGIRISRSGRRFRISAATIWNILDAQGEFLGQAASFGHWENLV